MHVGSRNEEQAEALRGIEQAQRRLEVALASPSFSLPDLEAHEVRSTVGRTQTEVSALRRQFDAPRRKLFTPPMPESWQEQVEAVSKEQSRAWSRIDAAAALPRRFGLLSAQLRGRLTRVTSRLNALATTWQVDQARTQVARLTTEYERLCSNMPADAAQAVTALEALAFQVEEWERVVDGAPEFDTASAATQLGAWREFLDHATYASTTELVSRRDLMLVASWPRVQAQAETAAGAAAQSAERQRELLEKLNTAVDECIRRKAEGSDVTAALDALDDAAAAVTLHGVREDTVAMAEAALGRAGQV